MSKKHFARSNSSALSSSSSVTPRAQPQLPRIVEIAKHIPVPLTLAQSQQLRNLSVPFPQPVREQSVVNPFLPASMRPKKTPEQEFQQLSESLKKMKESAKRDRDIQLSAYQKSLQETKGAKFMFERANTFWKKMDRMAFVEQIPLPRALPPPKEKEVVVVAEPRRNGGPPTAKRKRPHGVTFDESRLAIRLPTKKARYGFGTSANDKDGNYEGDDDDDDEDIDDDDDDDDDDVVTKALPAAPLRRWKGTEMVILRHCATKVDKSLSSEQFFERLHTLFRETPGVSQRTLRSVKSKARNLKIRPLCEILDRGDHDSDTVSE